MIYTIGHLFSGRYSEPQTLAIASNVGGFACVLNLDDIPPSIWLTAVEISEPVDPRQMLYTKRYWLKGIERSSHFRKLTKPDDMLHTLLQRSLAILRLVAKQERNFGY